MASYTENLCFGSRCNTPSKKECPLSPSSLDKFYGQDCLNFLVNDRRSNTSVPSLRIITMRDMTDSDENAIAFWKKHHQSYDIIQQYQYLPVEEANKLLCDSIINIFERFPNAYIVSDDPQYNLRILDNILETYGHNPVSQRGGNLYSQCICTWSFRFSILSLLGFPESHVDRFLGQRGIIVAGREIDNYFGPLHTPWSDCARILSNHCKMLDVISLSKSPYYYQNR